MERSSRAEWADRIRRLRRSGLTLREFAATEGVKASTLSYWKWRLSRETKSRKPKKSTALALRTLPFVEVSQARAVVSAEPYELELPSGIRIRVPRDFETESLTALLSVLGRQ